MTHATPARHPAGRPTGRACWLAVVATLLAATGAHAGTIAADTDMDPRFRAKLVKEKLRMSAMDQEASRQARGQGTGAGQAGCGSQSIGVVDTNGKIGASPREVFVYAPNAINFVNARGCQ